MRANLKKPCAECPFRRDSAQGWLGGYDSPEHFLDVHYDHEPQPNPCHMSVDWEALPGDLEAKLHELDTNAEQCFGQLVMFANSCKVPRTWRPPIEVEEDRVTVFKWTSEFIAHHTLKPLASGKMTSSRAAIQQTPKLKKRRKKA